MGIPQYFSTTYAEARQKFLEAARAVGAVSLEAHVNPNAKGANGEELALDVARFGDRDAENLLIVAREPTATRASAAPAARLASSRRASSTPALEPSRCCWRTPSTLMAFPMSAG